MPVKKQRLDRLLVQLGLAPSRERARALIMAGKVRVENRRVDKAGTLVLQDADIFLESPDHPFVSRGGLKLDHALKVFSVNVAGRVAIDVGASTGGFTDCLLQAGAALVFAVDVGYGQLSLSLRNDQRVMVFERTNIRYLEPKALSCTPDLAVVDVSFISLKKVLPQIMNIMQDRGEILALVKPQFEVGKGAVGKGGVVRNPALHKQVLGDISDFAREMGYRVNGVTSSPITGPKGNREFFLHLKCGANDSENNGGAGEPGGALH